MKVFSGRPCAGQGKVKNGGLERMMQKHTDGSTVLKVFFQIMVWSLVASWNHKTSARFKMILVYQPWSLKTMRSFFGEGVGRIVSTVESPQQTFGSICLLE